MKKERAATGRNWKRIKQTSEWNKKSEKEKDDEGKEV